MSEEIRIPPTEIPLPPPITPVSPTSEPLVRPEEPGRVHELDDLFEVPQPEDNDMEVDDLFEIPEEDIDFSDDLSDITQVTNEDVMGSPPKPKAQPRFRRTTRPYYPPPSLGGIR